MGGDFLIDRTLIDFASYLILEAVALACLGYLNFYVPEEQKIKAEKYSMERNYAIENNTVENTTCCIIELHKYMNEKCFFVLSFATLTISWAFFLVTNIDLIILEITSSNILGDVSIVLLLVLVFVMSVPFLFITPFLGAEKSIKYYKECYFQMYGVIIEVQVR